MDFSSVINSPEKQLFIIQDNMRTLSTLADSLVGSEIVKLGNEINLRKSKGEHIYNYTIGDFDPQIFPIPSQLEAYIIEAYQHKKTNYPPGDGLLSLRQAVGDWFRNTFHVDYANDEIQISSGGRPIIYTIFKSLVDPQDKVIYTAPSWNNNHYTHMNQGKHCVLNVTPEQNFMPTAADIAPHIKGAALICLCSPQNPTGTTLDKEELIKICQLVIEENTQRAAGEKKLFILFDQMYWTLTYGNTQHHHPVQLVPGIKEYCIFVDGVSKAFAATGVRVGWAMGPKDVIVKIKAFLSHIGAWAPMAEQFATAQFLNDTEAVNTFLTDIKSKLKARLDFIYEKIQAMQSEGLPVDAIAPQAALYLTIKLDFRGYKNGIHTLESQADVTNYILSEAKLAIVPFNCFGADTNSPWYRVSVGTCRIEDLTQAFGQLDTALKKLAKQ